MPLRGRDAPDSGAPLAHAVRFHKKVMEDKFNYKEFHNFRWAHARANAFLYGIFILFALVVGLIRSFLGIDTKLFSVETLYILIVLAVFVAPVPYLGYKLARHIVGGWYLNEFGASYKEYLATEKQVVKREGSRSEI